MTSIVFFVERVATGLFLLGLGGLLFFANRLRQARSELRMAQFKLEREHALVRQANAITFGGLLLEALIAVWAISNMVAPTLRDIQVSGDTGPLTYDRFVTSTPAMNPPVSLDSGTTGVQGPVLASTPPPTNTPVGTIIPDAPAIVGCPRDSAWIYIPGNGQLLFEATTVQGTANIADFAFYRFEIKPAQPGAQFSILGDETQPVIDGPLGVIYPWQFPVGEYRFRLVVFDSTYIERAVCEITIHISTPPPTPTPIGAPGQ